MKITAFIARFLLGIIFLVFGLNGFLHFIPSSPPSGTAGQFVGALFVTHYLVPIFLLQIISAVLLLVNRYVPLRADATCSDHRQHSAHPHIDASERSAFGYRRDGALDRRVSQCPLRLRRSLPTARCCLNRNHQQMQIGIDSFVAAAVDAAGQAVDPERHLSELLQAITLADEVGLDVFGIGEHHRREFLDSAPTLHLALLPLLSANRCEFATNSRFAEML